jgi:hypothetical protein
MKTKVEKPELSTTEMPGYPLYPKEEDIFSKLKKVGLEEAEKDTSNKKIKTEEMDVPGSELDDEQENIGSEDEENNYYSLGGDNHDD